MGKTIGIDLGTTNSCIAFVDNGNPTVIQTKAGARVMASVVAFTAKGERLVGLVAKRQAITNPKNTISSIKRLMGRKFSEVSDLVKRVSYTIEENSNGDAAVRIMDRLYTPPEVSAIILQRLKHTAEEFLGEDVTEAVITVPAYFNEVQREATKAAGVIAGLSVRRVLNEPTAAALAFMEPKESKRIAVYDFGGGTFDISVLQVVNGVFEVKSTCGDTNLGGDDLDSRLVDWIMEQFRTETGIDLNRDQIAPQRVREAAERAKCELSMTLETSINLPFIASGDSGPVHMEISITRKLFQSLVSDLVERTRELCQKAVEDAGFRMEDLDHVVLVGGSTRIPMVKELVEQTFGRKPAQSVNPDEVVAMGAALEGAVLSGQKKDLVLIDVTPLSLGVETLGGVMAPIIKRNSPIPMRRGRIFTTAVDNQSVVSVHVLQGERDLAEGNRSLGTFELRGIPPARRGEPRVEVLFEIDSNGILNVSAKDMNTGNAHSIKVNPSGGLTSDEIARLKKEAEANAEADRARILLTGHKNQADELMYDATKILKAAKEQVDRESWQGLEEDLAKLRELRDSDNADSIAKQIAKTRIQVEAVSKLIEVFETRLAEEAGGLIDDIEITDEPIEGMTGV